MYFLSFIQSFIVHSFIPGGWLKVGSAIIATKTESKEVEFKKVLSDDISRLSEVENGRFLLGRIGLQR